MAAPTKRWDPVWDDREKLATAAGVERDVLDKVIDALFDVVCSSPRTRIVGKGEFYWGVCNRTLPGGSKVSSRRLCVRLSRSLDTLMKSAAIPGAVSLEEI